MFRRGYGRPRPWDWRRRPSFGGSLIGGLISGAASELGADLVDAVAGGGQPEYPPQAASPPAAAPVVVNVTVAANTVVATPSAPVSNTP